MLGYPGCPPARSPSTSDLERDDRGRKEADDLEAIDSRGVAIVVGVALVSSVLVLLIQRFVGAGDWDWAEALTSFVQLVATAVVIVGLLEWYRRRRWRRAEDEDLRSLILLSGLVPSGWRRLSPYRSTAPSFEHCGIKPILVLYENFAADYETSTLNLLERLDLSCPEDFEFELRMKRQSDRINDDWTKRYSELRLGRDFDLFPVPVEEKARERA